MSTIIADKKSILGATALIAGCCIGAATLGLPIISLIPGFIPSSIAILFSYLFTTITGLLLLESTLWFNQKTNLLSISNFALGKFGKIITGSLFIFLFYSIFIAYMDGGGILFCNFIKSIFGIQYPYFLGVLSYVGLVGSVICLGLGIAARINKILISGLLATYVTMVLIGLSHVDLQKLTHISWQHSLGTLPILFICFGYQNLVPSLVDYLKRDVQAVRKVIVLGNLIPMCFYLAWNFIILGIAPSKYPENMMMVTDLLQQATQTNLILYLSEAFSFFALTTSFIAVGLSFVDFFSDGLQSIQSKNRTTHKAIIIFLVFIPPLILCYLYPRIFLKALDFAGGVIDVLLFGVLPVLFVWSGRYIKRVKSPYVLGGGKTLLLSVLGLCLFLLLLRI